MNKMTPKDQCSCSVIIRETSSIAGQCVESERSKLSLYLILPLRELCRKEGERIKRARGNGGTGLDQMGSQHQGRKDTRFPQTSPTQKLSPIELNHK